MFSKSLRQYAKKSLILKHLVRWYRASIYVRRSNWNRILGKDKDFWEQTLKESKQGQKILIATSVGSHWPGTYLESLLSVALTLRGSNVHVLLCDSSLPACMICRVDGYPKQKHFVCYGPSKDICKSCFSPANKVFRSIGIPVHRYSSFITPKDLQNAEYISSTVPLADIGDYTLEGVAVGEHALAGTLRFYARGSLDGEPYAEPVLRRYFKASLLTTYATSNLLKKYNFDCIVFHHGIYVPQGLIGEVARKEKTRVINWNPAYRKRCFIFSEGDTYHHTLMSEPVEKWENIHWTPELDAVIMDYLNSRWHGTQDWISFQEKPQIDLSAIANEIGVDFSKPCIGMLTNVVWDAQLHYPANAFPNMIEWVIRTIQYFSNRPEIQIIIRVHPAEIRGFIPSRQRIVDEINKVFPNLPKNIIVIPPESHISTYAVMLQCNTSIIYGTKTGVELTSMGIPVIVAGEAWIRNKGITVDVTSTEDYFKLLDSLPLSHPLSEVIVQRARKYAYHFFFRRMIPLEFMEPISGNFPFKIQLSGLKDLLPGHSSGLDVICNGILKGTDFIYPAEQFTNDCKEPSLRSRRQERRI